MKKITLAALPLTAACLLTSTAAMANSAVKLSFATVASPSQLQVKALEIFKQKLAASTHGQIKVQIYASGQLFGTKSEQEQAVEMGNVDMAFIGGGTVQKQIPTFTMFQSAYLFKNYAVFHKVMNSREMGKFYAHVSHRINVLPLDGWYLGARQLNYRDIGHAIRTPADLKGVKLRMPDSPAFLDLAQALGANPTPLAFTQVYISLQTGVIDAQDNPLPTDKAMKFYEVAPNISLTHHCLEPIFPAINLKVWNSLTKTQQQDVRSAIKVAGAYMASQTRAQSAQLVKFFSEHGVKIVHPDIQAFYQHAKKWYAAHPRATKGWNTDGLYDYIKKANANAG